MALVSTICPECKASIKLDDSKPFGFCLSCGAKIAFCVSVGKADSSNTGTNNSQALISNYMNLAVSASKAKNQEQCELYCNKIIELDFNNYAAWALKASAAGWQSSLNNLRIEEMIQCYGKAIQFAQTADKKEMIKNTAKEDFRDIIDAIFKLQGDRFAKWPDAEESLAIVNFNKRVLDCTNSFFSNVCPVDIEYLLHPAAMKVNNCAVAAFDKAKLEFNNDNDGHPSDYALKLFIERCGYIESVYNAALIMYQNDYENIRITCDNLIVLHNSCINAKSYSATYVGDPIGWYYQTSQSLTDSAVAARRKQISIYESKKREAQRKKEEEAAQAQRNRIKAYWDRHPVKKELLTKESNGLGEEVRQLEKEIADIEKGPDVIALKDEIAALRAERQALGVFSIKEKKALDDKINKLESDLKNYVNGEKTRLQNLIAPKKARISVISNELRKDRTQAEINSPDMVRPKTLSPKHEEIPVIPLPQRFGENEWHPAGDGLHEFRIYKFNPEKPSVGFEYRNWATGKIAASYNGNINMEADKSYTALDTDYKIVKIAINEKGDYEFVFMIKLMQDGKLKSERRISFAVPLKGKTGIEPLKAAEEYIIGRLKTVSDIAKIDSVTKSNDPNGKLGKPGEYISLIYFSSPLVDASYANNNSLDVIKIGKNCGGCIEVYTSPVYAEKRVQYLKKNFNSMEGSIKALNNIVIRISYKISGELQQKLAKETEDAILGKTAADPKQAAKSPGDLSSGSDVWHNCPDGKNEFRACLFSPAGPKIRMEVRDKVSKNIIGYWEHKYDLDLSCGNGVTIGTEHRIDNIKRAEYDGFSFRYYFIYLFNGKKMREEPVIISIYPDTLTK